MNSSNGMSKPLVTVLMPCYNASKFLNEAMESILNQTYRNLEVLAIDDGSSDNTIEIIRKYAEMDSRVKPVVNEVNLGLIKTLNKGCDLAKGVFIARMDSDDISEPDRIECLVDALESDPSVSLVSAGCYRISESGKQLSRVHPKACLSKAMKFVSFFLTPVLHPCVIFRSSMIEENRFDEDYLHSEDYELFSRLLLSGVNFSNLDKPLYRLRINFHSVSHKFEAIQISTHNRISFRNINDYFGIQYDYFVQRVMTNRINFSVPPNLLKESLDNLDKLRMLYIQKENPSQLELEDIDGFLIEQRIDIHIQSLKNSNGWLVAYHLFACIRSWRLFFSPRGIQFLKSKNWFKKQQY
ncbi:MAG: glycosyltransferase family 2 protein [Bacteroidota bacterium]